MAYKDILITNTKLYLSKNYEKLKADSVLQVFNSINRPNNGDTKNSIAKEMKTYHKLWVVQGFQLIQHCK